MDCLTKKDIEDWVKTCSEDALFCPSCHSELMGRWRNVAIPDEGVLILYCPNEVCLNDEQYDKYGNSFS